MVKRKAAAGSKLVARSVKVSDDDWQQWKTAAAADGLNVSAWLKQLARRAIKRAKRMGEL